VISEQRHGKEAKDIYLTTHHFGENAFRISSSREIRKQKQIAIMAQELLASARQTMKDTISGQNSKKTNDLQQVTKDVHDKSWRITSDSGTKQSNTDDWLSVVNEDHTGPMLLEDNFAREKV